MLRFITKRLLQSILVLFLFLSATFFLAQLIMPGDFAILLGFGTGAEKVNEIRTELGLNQPIGQRYLEWLGGVVSGDLGKSFFKSADFRHPGSGLVRLPVTAIIWRALLLSSIVFGVGTVAAFRIGEWLGKATAWRKAGLFTGLSMIVGIVLYTAFPPLLAWLAFEANRPFGIFQKQLTRAVWDPHYLESTLWWPSKVAALMLVTLAVVALGLMLVNTALARRHRRRIPPLAFAALLIIIWSAGWVAIGAGARVLDITRFVGLGVIVYVMLSFGETMLIMRTSMTDTLYEQYIFAARAKGLSEAAIRDRHASRNALLPVLSRLIINMPYLLTGLVMIEDAVGTGGMGTVLFESLRQQDIPVLMGALLLIGAIAMTSRLVLEIIIAYLDPRIRIVQTGSETTRAIAELRGGGPLAALKARFSRSNRAQQRPASEGHTGISSRPGPARTALAAGVWQQTRLRMRALWRRFRADWQVFAANRIAVFGLILIALFILMAVVHPLLLKTVWPNSIYNPSTGYDMTVFPHPAPPSLRHLLGTDALGRDILSMLMAASSPTLKVALAASITAAIISTAIGALSAYYQGTPIDTLFRYLSDVLLIMPAPILMVILGTRFPEQIGPLLFGLIYGLMVGAGSIAIVMRSQALTLMARPFIEASWVAGSSGRRIILVHLIPHMLPLAAVQMMLTVAGAVIAYGFIAFAGVTRFELNWGAMVYVAFNYSMSIAEQIPWMQLLAPALALSLFAASFYFVSRGFHAIAEPRLRER